MNSIGKPLSLADLVRNYLLMGKDSFMQEYLYKNYWLKIESEIPGQVSNFIRDYMQVKICKQCKQSTEKNYKELYIQFKNLNVAHGDIEALLAELVEYSSYYSFLCMDVSCGDSGVDREIGIIKQLKTTTVCSFLLELLFCWKNEKLNSLEINDIIHSFNICLLRRRIADLPSNHENVAFPEFVSQIPFIMGSFDKVQAVFNMFKNVSYSLRVPNDEEIMKLVNDSNYNFYRFRYAKLYLSLIEGALTKSPDVWDDNTLQIEHIMPQTLSSGWIDSLGQNYKDIHMKYLDQIGNITLIRHNQELGNKSFEIKKEIYNNRTGLQIAKSHIVEKSQWGENEIMSRSEWLINVFLNEVVPIPNDMRYGNNYNVRRGLHFEDLDLVGKTIEFIDYPQYKAVVVSDKEVEFEGKIWKMSPLTRELYTRHGECNQSGSYEGACYWSFNGIKLKDMYS